MATIKNIKGVFSPFFGSQLTLDQEILTIYTKNKDVQKIKLYFVSAPVEDKQQATGEFKIAYVTGDSETRETLLDDIGLNHARNFSSWRRDLVHWQLDIEEDTTTFTIWFYNNVASKTFNVNGDIYKIDLNNTNCIHHTY